EQVPRAKRVEQVGKSVVEVLQAAMEVDGIVPVAPEHVRLDEVDEDEALVELPEEPLGLLDPVDVRFRRQRLVDVAAGEDIPDLADPEDLLAGLADERQIVRPSWLEREIVSVRRADVIFRLTGERPRDDTSNGVLA